MPTFFKFEGSILLCLHRLQLGQFYSIQSLGCVIFCVSLYIFSETLMNSTLEQTLEVHNIGISLTSSPHFLLPFSPTYCCLDACNNSMATGTPLMWMMLELGSKSSSSLRRNVGYQKHRDQISQTPIPHQVGRNSLKIFF